MSVCYSIQYKGVGVTAKVYRKHRFVCLFVFIQFSQLYSYKYSSSKSQCSAFCSGLPWSFLLDLV